MNRRMFLPAIAFLLLMQCNLFAQSKEVPKFEIGAEFAALEREDFGDQRMEAGAGARFTFNFNRSLAFETAGYFFPHKCFCRNSGNMGQVVAGVKYGKRFEKWGIFAKARPGVVTFSRGEFKVVRASASGVDVEINRITSFAADLGGVLEFYPSPKIVTRFDVGDTIIRFGRRTLNGVDFNPTTQEFFLVPFVTPARTTHNFQFTAGVGFRF